MKRRTWILVSPALVALVSACTLLEVPFEPEDGTGGQSPGEGTGGSDSGATGGWGTGGWETGGATGTAASNGWGGDYATPSGGATAWPDVSGAEPIGAGGSGIWGPAGGMVEHTALALTPVRIMGIATTDDYVYWVTSTTRDGGQEEGRFYRKGHEGGPVEAASYFTYPTRLEVTSTYAYVWLEDSPTQSHTPFVKVELATGNYEPEPVGATVPERFAAFEHLAYFMHDLGEPGLTYGIDEESGLFEHGHGHQSRKLREEDVLLDFAADATHLYFQSHDKFLLRAPLDDPGNTEVLSDDEMEQIALDSDSGRIIGFDAETNTLSRMSSSGGAWTVAATVEPRGYVELVVRGDRFFLVDYDNGTSLTTGTFSEGQSELYMLFSDVWSAREDGFYATKGDELVRVDLN